MPTEDNDTTATDGEGKSPIAVAVSYAPETNRAPTVVASGRGSLAEQILAIAFANDVRVREDADLAELLSAVDVDSEIPVGTFAAVAEILVYVYRANGMLPPDPDTAAPVETETP